MEMMAHSREGDEEEDEIGELFVICCPQDREFAKRKLCPALRSLSNQPVSMYSGREMSEADALARLEDSTHCCVATSAAGINALQLQLAGVSPARYRAVDMCTVRLTAEPASTHAMIGSRRGWLATVAAAATTAAATATGATAWSISPLIAAAGDSYDDGRPGG